MNKFDQCIFEIQKGKGSKNFWLLGNATHWFELFQNEYYKFETPATKAVSCLCITRCGKLKDGVLDLIVPHNVQRFEICSLPIAIKMNNGETNIAQLKRYAEI